MSTENNTSPCVEAVTCAFYSSCVSHRSALVHMPDDTQVSIAECTQYRELVTVAFTCSANKWYTQ